MFLKFRDLAFSTLLFLDLIRARATTIVVIRTPIDVSIAADSLGTFGNQTRPVCKVYRSYNIFLGVAGIDNDSITKFSVSRIVFRAIRSELTFGEKMVAATKAIKAELLTEARSLKDNRPGDFANLIDPEKGGLTIILLGMEGQTPFAIGQKFNVAVSASGDVSIAAPAEDKRQCPGNDCPNGVYVFKLGQHKVIDEYLHDLSHRQISDSADTARMLVQLEIDAHTSGVGPPIFLRRVNANGQSWTKQKPTCPIEVEPVPAKTNKSRRSKTLHRWSHFS